LETSEKRKKILEALEEDDEFQEFNTQDEEMIHSRNDKDEEGNQKKTQWLSDWDDDTKESNFIANLRKELQ
jgi:hypothetical protein